MQFLFFCLLVAPVFGEVYIHEGFDDPKSIEKWVYSKKDQGTQGKVELSASKDGYAPDNKGLKTTENAKFYLLSRQIEQIDNKDKPLVVQYTMKFDDSVSCGGSYIKLVGSDVNSEDFDKDSRYALMFGPDICGTATKKVHVILNYGGKNVMIKKDIRCEDDKHTHLYSLTITPDQKYKVSVDCKVVQEGSLEDDFDFLPPKMIKDPSISKPADWVDKDMIEDPDDVEPSDWVKEEKIRDPEAKKPDDWDEDSDGEWEAPLIDNPDYKGLWSAKLIPNPEYKGPWIHPEIENPDYPTEYPPFHIIDADKVAIEVWQVDSGSIYDNILVTNNVLMAEAEAKKICDGLPAEKEYLSKQKKDEPVVDAALPDDIEDEEDEEESEEPEDKPEQVPSDDHSDEL